MLLTHHARLWAHPVILKQVTHEHMLLAQLLGHGYLILPHTRLAMLCKGFS